MIIVSINIYFEYFLDEDDSFIKSFDIFDDNISRIILKPLKFVLL